VVIKQRRVLRPTSPKTATDMSLQLHPDCKRRLIEKTTELLQSMNVTTGNALESDSFLRLFELDSVLPSSGSVRALLEEYVGETPAFKFMSHNLAKNISESLQYDADAPTIPLMEIEKYKDTQAVARWLVEGFESLPWAYSLTFDFANDFGKLFSQTVKEYPLGDTASLIAPDAEFNEEFPLSKGGEPGARLKSRLLGLFSPKHGTRIQPLFKSRSMALFHSGGLVHLSIELFRCSNHFLG
jgi:hypothetical protein